MYLYWFIIKLFQIRIDGFADNYLKVPQQLLETSLTKVELTLHSSDTQQLVGHLNGKLYFRDGEENKISNNKII
jgi:hypothetical protein